MATRCARSIYESSSEESWVACRVRNAQTTATVVMVFLVILFFSIAGGMRSLPGIAITGAIFGGIGTIVEKVLMARAPVGAHEQWVDYQERLRAYEASGMSTADAVAAVQREDIHKKQMAAIAWQNRRMRAGVRHVPTPQTEQQRYDARRREEEWRRQEDRRQEEDRRDERRRQERADERRRDDERRAERADRS